MIKSWKEQVKPRLGMPYERALHNNNVEIHNTPTGEYNYSQYIPYVAIGGILIYLLCCK